METQKSLDFALIGKSVIIKGELTGSEDLFIEGQVEGSIELPGGVLIIGPNGQVRADIQAKGVIVQGKLEGNINANDRAELRKTAVVVGDIVTQRVSIEDGAYFKGKVNLQKDESKLVTKAEVKNVPVPSAAAAGVDRRLSIARRRSRRLR